MTELFDKVIDKEAAWNKFVEDLAEGNISIIDVMKVILQDSDEENYYKHVAHARSMHVIMGDMRIVKRLHDDISEKLAAIDGGEASNEKFRKQIIRKDGPRLLNKLASTQADVYGDGPHLLSGKDFDECLSQYKKMMSHVEDIWDNACDAYRKKNFPHATFFSILTIEEIGKLGRLWYDLLAYDQLPANSGKNLNLSGKDHRKKHFLGVVSGAVVNSRIDNILGVENIKKLLEDTESGRLEKIRQSCLYIDVINGVASIPRDIIDGEKAKFFTILSGELWAEILGHFPWEFSRMIEKVTNFEVELGYDRSFVRRGGGAEKL